MTPPARERPPQLRDVPMEVIGQAGVIVIGGIVLGFLLSHLLLWGFRPPLKPFA